MFNILVVDDDPICARFLREGFTLQRCRVRTALDLHGALQIVENFTPDLLVADMLLSVDCTGSYVSEILRTRFPQMRTIFMTGLPLEIACEYVAPGSAARIMRKPLSHQEIRCAIEAFITRDCIVPAEEAA